MELKYIIKFNGIEVFDGFKHECIREIQTLISDSRITSPWTLNYQGISVSMDSIYKDRIVCLLEELNLYGHKNKIEELKIELEDLLAKEKQEGKFKDFIIESIKICNQVIGGI
ncbi:MAG: hypothetical protein ACRCW9_05945 [Cetobacterium sp.]